MELGECQGIRWVDGWLRAGCWDGGKEKTGRSAFGRCCGGCGDWVK